MLKSMLVNTDFQTWQHSRQPIRSHVSKSVLTNMAFNMDFCLVTPSPGEYKSGFVEGISDITQWGATQLVSWHVLTWVSIELYIINSTSD